jgi:hypothetical protein
VASPIDVRAGLAAALKRMVREPAEWPIRDRRRFRNLLLDAVSSDALPLTELLLSVHDSGAVDALPARTAGRAAWDTATARMAGDLQTQRFLEPGVARFVAETWAAALGPDAVPSARAASPRPAVAPRTPPRPSAPYVPPARSTPQPPAPPSAASLKAYKQSNMLFLLMAAAFGILTILAFRNTGSVSKSAAPAAASPEPVRPETVTSAVRGTVVDARRFDVQTPRTSPTTPSATSGAAPVAAAPVADTAPRPASPPPPVTRAPLPVAPAGARTSDDIVLKAGRVFEGRVLSVRTQGVTVRDDATGLEFEVAKADIDRIVTRDGRTMRFGDDNVPLLGDDDALTPASYAGRFRVRYAERWGTERPECRDIARRFAPGTDLIVQHLRGAPMLRLGFVDGQGYNASVRSDGLFETESDIAPQRGPQGSFVTTRVSGRFARNGGLRGVARLNASMPDGTIVCDLALTLSGDRLKE